LQKMCLAAGQHIIDSHRYADLGIPTEAIPLIEWAWDVEPPAIYGRMDLTYDGVNPPKLLEYNADTPTGLLEAAVVQWYWKEEVSPKSDQFNSIHERLVAKWTDLGKYLGAPPLYFTHIDDPQGEDTITANYLRDTAEDAGVKTAAIKIPDIGWDGSRFVDLDLQPIMSIFKLYPWEWLIHEEFGGHALATYKDVMWIEPIWKMLLSNKGILPILWELYPGHRNLLEAHFDGPHDMKEFVKKPKMSREGANITLVQADGTMHTDGDYGEEGFVYQELKLARIDGHFPVLGSWVIDGESAGIGIRESETPITNNLSAFVPHIFT